MNHTYPQGAVTSEQELLTLTYVWEASREFKCCIQRKLTGTAGETRRPIGQPYHWWGYQTEAGSEQHSFLDMNIPPNGYNDWYIFSNRKAAEDYVNGRPA